MQRHIDTNKIYKNYCIRLFLYFKICTSLHFIRYMEFKNIFEEILMFMTSKEMTETLAC